MLVFSPNSFDFSSEFHAFDFPVLRDKNFSLIRKCEQVNTVHG